MTLKVKQLRAELETFESALLTLNPGENTRSYSKIRACVGYNKKSKSARKSVKENNVLRRDFYHSFFKI